MFWQGCLQLQVQQLVQVYYYYQQQTIKSKILAYVISKTECQACGTCKDECPQEAIIEGDVYSIDPDKCVECGACADACPCGAIAPGN